MSPIRRRYLSLCSPNVGLEAVAPVQAMAAEAMATEAMAAEAMAAIEAVTAI